jgi:hypothetical protein
MHISIIDSDGTSDDWNHDSGGGDAGLYATFLP